MKRAWVAAAWEVFSENRRWIGLEGPDKIPLLKVSELQGRDLRPHPIYS